ncbi:uncharacterized protein LOC144007408 isoform X2 [Festucalex cinctus]
MKWNLTFSSSSSVVTISFINRDSKATTLKIRFFRNAAVKQRRRPRARPAMGKSVKDGCCLPVGDTKWRTAAAGDFLQIYSPPIPRHVVFFSRVAVCFLVPETLNL